MIDARKLEEVSIGDYVLSGGEIAAMADRRLRPVAPGGDGPLKLWRRRKFFDGLLEYPQYTRPQAFEGRPIPEILLSGDHAKVAKWRLNQAEALTQVRRPDLWAAKSRPGRPKSGQKTRRKVTTGPLCRIGAPNPRR